MKMRDATYTRLSDAITPLDTPQRRARYTAGDIPRADAVSDLDKRYRWDLLWDVLPALRADGFELYADELDDTHVDTALRRIVPALNSPNR